MSASDDALTVSKPPPPTSVFVPLPPVNTLSAESPVIVSLKSEPMTLRNPLADVNPVAVPVARFTVTPLVAAE